MGEAVKRVRATGDSRGFDVGVGWVTECLRQACPQHTKIALSIREVRDSGGVIETESIRLTRSQARRLIRHLEEACHE
jgi:hypothetical protein